MKFTVDTNIIKESLENAVEFSQQKTHITSNIYIELKNDDLKIRATDNKFGYTSFVKVKGSKNGELTIPSSKISDIVKLLNDDEIQFSKKDDEKIEIKSKHSQTIYYLKYSNAITYPEEENFDSDNTIQIDSDIFKKLLSQAMLSVSEVVLDGDSKDVYNGILIKFDNNKLSMVSTNGRSLSYAEDDFKLDKKYINREANIPVKFARLFLKLLKEDQLLNINIRDNLLLIKANNFIIYSTLYKNPYPNYKKVIEREYRHSVVLNVQDLITSLKKVSILSDSQSKKIIFKFSDNKLTINAVDIDTGSASDSMSCDFSGEEVEFAINYTYLINHLKSLTSDYVEISFIDSSSQIRVKPTTDEKYEHIIMSMQI